MWIRRTAAIALMAAALFLGAAAGVMAQSQTTPRCPGTSIRAPFASSVISGTIEILGSARIEGFRFYKLEWAPASEPESWRAVSQTIERSVSNGLLDRWDTRVIPDGRYRLKLTSVDDRADERCRFVVENLIVANQALPSPQESPTSLPSPTALERARATDVPADAATEPIGGEEDEQAQETAVATSNPSPEIEDETDADPDAESEDAVEALESEAAASEDQTPLADEDLEGGDTGMAEKAEDAESSAEDGADTEADESTSGAGFLRSILNTFLLAFLATALLAGLVLVYRARQARELES